MLFIFRVCGVVAPFCLLSFSNRLCLRSMGAAARARCGGGWRRASSAGSRSHQNIQSSRGKISDGRLAEFDSKPVRESHASLRHSLVRFSVFGVSFGSTEASRACSEELRVAPSPRFPPRRRRRRRRRRLGQDAAQAHSCLLLRPPRGPQPQPASDPLSHTYLVRGGMEAVYPAAASALARGRRARRAGLRARHRTTPVTFAEIKEVDEEKEEECAPAPASRGSGSGERRRPDVLDERLARQFSEFRRRRRRDALPEPPDEPAEPAGAALRAGSEPLEPR